jgi:DNA-binding GntR family transcriptional regulator
MEHVYEALKNTIIDGALQPGEPLSVERLSDEMRVGSMMVLEALMRLRAEGLVRTPARRSFMVAPVSGTDLVELFETRILIEGQTARDAARTLRNETILSMRSAFARIRNVVADGVGVPALPVVREFHFHLYNGLRNEWLTRLIEHLWDQSARYHALCMVGALTASEVIGNHKRILEAAEKRSPARCQAAIADDLSITMEGIRNHLSSSEYHRSLRWLPFTR